MPLCSSLPSLKDWKLTLINQLVVSIQMWLTIFSPMVSTPTVYTHPRFNSSKSRPMPLTMLATRMPLKSRPTNKSKLSMPSRLALVLTHKAPSPNTNTTSSMIITTIMITPITITVVTSLLHPLTPMPPSSPKLSMRSTLTVHCSVSTDISCRLPRPVTCLLALRLFAKLSRVFNSVCSPPDSTFTAMTRTSISTIRTFLITDS